MRQLCIVKPRFPAAVADTAVVAVATDDGTIACDDEAAAAAESTEAAVLQIMLRYHVISKESTELPSFVLRSVFCVGAINTKPVALSVFGELRLRHHGCSKLDTRCSRQRWRRTAKGYGEFLARRCVIRVSWNSTRALYRRREQ